MDMTSIALRQIENSGCIPAGGPEIHQSDKTLVDFVRKPFAVYSELRFRLAAIDVR